MAQALGRPRWVMSDPATDEPVADPTGEGEQLVSLPIDLSSLPVAVKSLGVGLDDHS